MVFPGSFRRKIYFGGEAVELAGEEGFEAACDVKKAGVCPEAVVAEDGECWVVQMRLAHALTGNLFTDEFGFIEGELAQAEGEGVERGAQVGRVRLGFLGLRWV